MSSNQIYVFWRIFFCGILEYLPPPVHGKKSENALTIRISVLYWLIEFRGICLKYERVGGEVMDREANSLGEEFASHEDAS